MEDILVICKTEIPNRKAVYFNIEMSVEFYPTKEDTEELKKFLTPHTPNIIDDIVGIIHQGEVIWQIEQ